MATINSQLGIANVDTTVSSDTSESQEDGGFLAVLESFQAEADNERQSAKTITEDFAATDNEQRPDPQQLAPQDNKEKSGQTEPKDNNGKHTESAQSADETQLDDAQANKKSNAQPSEQAPNALQNTATEETAKNVQRSTDDRSTYQQQIISNSAIDDAVADESQKAASQSFESDIKASSNPFLYLLTQSKAYEPGVHTIKGVRENTLHGAIEASHSSDENKLDGLTTDLEDELVKLDKASLTSLKSLLTLEDDKTIGVPGLSKEDLTKLVDKINLVLAQKSEKSNSAAASTNVTNSVAPLAISSDAKSVKITSEIADRKNSDVLVQISDEEIAAETVQKAANNSGREGNTNSISAGSATMNNVQQDRATVQTNHEMREAIEAKLTSAQKDSPADSQTTEKSVNSQILSLQQQINKLQLQGKAKVEVTLNEKPVADFKEDFSEVNFDNHESESAVSFSKLLSSLKSNASTPQLSQLVNQIQSTQVNQAELFEYNQQQVTQRFTQVIETAKQTSTNTEQALQQPVNIARSDAVKALYDKANMLLNLNLKEAEIRLDPPELGSMQIRVRSDA